MRDKLLDSDEREFWTQM